ncbi:T-lymphocyte surface antigen Ly-9 [Channa argus]|uniref:T-lymphocyte surface antigen Ly-9 n=1 Tax=Channa argus TaxID=215402 RepID=A0A6G1P9Z4_CHAAH|nr:T-lymphocyte surface antigen Ly-9 [Channa argus]
MERQQTFILLFFIVMSSSTAAKETILTATEGGKLTLPSSLMDMIFLLYNQAIISMVDKGELKIVNHIYDNRLHWNQSAECFTITDLQKNDSGLYAVQLGSKVTTYKLTVYERLPAPAVSTVSVNPESCFLLCSVDKAEETKLLWYKDEEVVNQSSSALSLPLTVHKQDFNYSYRCVAANDIEEKTLSVDIQLFCGQIVTIRRNRNSITVIVVPILLAGTIVLVALIAKQKYSTKKWTIGQKQGPAETETADVLYTDVCINYRQSEDIESLGPTDSSSQLITIYDKVEFHRMAPDYTEL